MQFLVIWLNLFSRCCNPGLIPFTYNQPGEIGILANPPVSKAEAHRELDTELFNGPHRGDAVLALTVLPNTDTKLKSCAGSQRTTPAGSPSSTKLLPPPRAAPSGHRPLLSLPRPSRSQGSEPRTADLPATGPRPDCDVGAKSPERRGWGPPWRQTGLGAGADPRPRAPSPPASASGTSGPTAASVRPSADAPGPSHCVWPST